MKFTLNFRRNKSKNQLERHSTTLCHEIYDARVRNPCLSWNRNEGNYTCCCAMCETLWTMIFKPNFNMSKALKSSRVCVLGAHRWYLPYFQKIICYACNEHGWKVIKSFWLENLRRIFSHPISFQSAPVLCVLVVDLIQFHSLRN